MTSQRQTVEHGTYPISPDGPTLAFALHHPTDAGQRNRAALIAHPYGRLGGCKEDHVVIALAERLASEGWTVLRYDARGAGASTGGVSWTGTAEATDYERMLQDVLLPAVLPNTAEPRTVTLLLGGYSYGSLAASACPPPSDTANVHLKTSYLLISYPLSVAWALCALQTSYFTSALRTRSEGHRVLAVYGDQDQFTAVEKFRRWAAELGRSGSFRSVELAGADHFWRNSEHKADLLSTICNWLS